MEQKQNYGQLFEKELEKIKQAVNKPTLLLHACCAPCSSYVLEYLSDIFDITVFFYNPNIAPESEYFYRADELQRLIREMGLEGSVKLVVADYVPDLFDSIAKGKEAEKERGSRCTDCYRIRLEKTYEYAKKGKFDYYTTTLSISPHKDAKRLNDIGSFLQENGSTKWLWSDFKKKEGYKRSIELSSKYNLYRQDYCGCIYSKINK